MSWGSLKRPGLWLVALIVLLAAPATPALAAGPAFDLGSTPRLLSGGATLGTVARVTGITAEGRGSGPCTTAQAPSGYPHAAFYRTTASERSQLRISVTDEVSGSRSLCRVAVYAAGSSFDPFRSGDRADAVLQQTSDCTSASRCSLNAWLSGGRTYVVALWAAPGSSAVQNARFIFDASVRAPSALSLRVAGFRIREACSGVYEVIAGRTYTVTAVAGDVEAAPVRFVVERASSGGWTTVSSYTRQLSDGRAALSLRATTSGRWRVGAFVEGTGSLLDGGATAVFHHISPRWKRLAGGGVMLTVPYYRQRYRLSCEAAALRMAHNYHDPSSIDHDLQVLRVVGIDRRAKSGGRWGNPNTHFVGDPNGYMMRTGYGVHYGPIARAATRYDSCRPAVKLYRPSRQMIARYVSLGYPVIVWGAHAGRNGIRYRGWRAFDGSWVRAYEIEHTWVVVGYRGSVANPTSFIIHNSSGPSSRTVSMSQFWAFTRYFGTAVVVRG